MKNITKTHEELRRMIANQMMKGPRPGRYAAGSTPEQREAFLSKHLNLIDEVIERIPRGSAAVGAVIAKAALRYGKEKPFEFAEKLRAGTFDGEDDPVFKLFKYAIRSKSTVNIYRTSVCAVRAYCEGRKLSHLRFAKSDIDDILAL